MQYLKISNQGTLDKEAFSLMGASSKGGSDKIGMFGTGFKYALATFLRGDMQVAIVSGNTKYSFEAKLRAFKNGSFRVMRYKSNRPNSRWMEMNMAAELGQANWNVKEALREIISNAIDEGGDNVELVDAIDVDDPNTAVYIENTMEVMGYYDNIGKYFLKFGMRVPVSGSGMYVKAYPKFESGVRVYRKGVLVYEGAEESLYDYEDPNISVDETRKATKWAAGLAFARFLNDCDKALRDSIIPRIIYADFEKGVEGYTWILDTGRNSDLKDKDVFYISEAVSDLHPEYIDSKCIVVPDNVARYLNGSCGAKGVKELLMGTNPIVGFLVELDPQQSKVYQHALSFIGKLGFYPENHKIVFCKFKDTSAFSESSDGTIYLDSSIFDDGLRGVCKNILRSIIKKESGEDSTEYLLEKYIQVASDHLGMVM